MLEAKQGSDREKKEAPDAVKKPKKGRKGTAVRGTKDWDDAMVSARGQAEQYARALPASEGRPPFLIVVDVGYSIEIYSEFSRTGGNYIPYPDPRTHRVLIRELAKEEIRETLRLVWADPMSLDPSRRSAKITREIAVRLAALAKSLEASGHSPDRAAAFLMRAVFTMFAEDVKLIPKHSFMELLEGMRGNVSVFPDMVQSLWSDMAGGGFSPILRQKLLRFNGGLFESAEALPVTDEQLELLIEASKADWRDVEPAIFGTLLERALDPRERHKLGAHYTPRAYVERLVMPAVIEPLRDEWRSVQAAAVTLVRGGDMDAAAAEVRSFHEKLCQTRVLDPACGSGNFLYVTLEHMKRLEGEVLGALEDFGVMQATLLTVDPHQLLGMEVNPRAAAIADLVLWIGYLQWHFRTRGEALPQEPVLRKFHNIEHRDAVLEYDDVEPVTDADDRPVTRWDGNTYKKHPVTGEDVPDDSARVQLLKYINPRRAVWPEADFIVGNPPFIGKGYAIREALGDGYVEALRAVYPEVPESADYVMYWWNQAADLLRNGKVRRFGFIATNSLWQTFNRRVLERHLSAENPLSIVFAIPDHPWVDSADGAAVRISMSVGEAGDHTGILNKVVRESRGASDEREVELSQRTGKIFSDLSIGANVAGAKKLRFGEGLNYNGMMINGAGFIVRQEEAKQLGLGRVPGVEQHIRPYRNGRDLTGTPRMVMIIDLYGLSIDEVRARFPEIYNWIVERVKPERDQNKDRAFRERWWLFGRSRPDLRAALQGLRRYIATVETSKHRFFVFLDTSILPDHMLISIALEDAHYLGVLSSRIHVAWALAAGGRLGVGNDPRYNKSRCFDTFPFPDCTEEHKSKIRNLAELLDAHRKRQQELHPKLTMTDMYNVLEKLRSGGALSERDKKINEQGLVSGLKQIHDDLDAAVFDAYGWPPSLGDDEVLERLVSLNAERAREEQNGLVRWLRPEFQKPQEPSQATLDTRDEEAAPAKALSKKEKTAWPSGLAEQAKAVRAALTVHGGAVTPEQLAKTFVRAKVEKVAELLETLASLGQARVVEGRRYVA